MTENEINAWQVAVEISEMSVVTVLVIRIFLVPGGQVTDFWEPSPGSDVVCNCAWVTDYVVESGFSLALLAIEVKPPCKSWSMTVVVAGIEITIDVHRQALVNETCS